MFKFIKKKRIRLLTSLVNVSSNSKCVSLNNHQCINQPTLINLYPNEYTQGLSYYPFSVNLDSCVGNCNNLNNYLLDTCYKQNIWI